MLAGDWRFGLNDDMDSRQPSPAVGPAQPRDLATHFMECGALNTNLTLAPGERMVITDDFLGGQVADLTAISMAAIVARDGMVAKAAILPLGLAASRLKASERIKYERLFALIEETAFDSGARESAEALIHAKFRDNQIRDLAAELGGTVGPARQRYKAFLDVVKLLTERKISELLFLDEFMDFTRAVAGKLDFGIYSVCVDRLFASERIPLLVKASLLREICKYPPLIRKELITNLLAAPKADEELVRYAREEVANVLTREQLTEIFLFTTLKRAWAAQKERPRPL